MPRAIDRFLEGRYAATSTVVTVLFVSVGRHLLDASRTAALIASPAQAIYGVSVSLCFYSAAFFLFAALLTAVLREPFERVGNMATVGLLIGLLPPLFDFALGSYRYGDYLYEFSPFFSSATQSTGETLTVWVGIAIATGFIGFVTRSLAKAAQIFVGAYLIFQLIGSLLIMFFQWLHALPEGAFVRLHWREYAGVASRSMLPFHWTNAAFLAIAAGLFVALRRGPVLKSFWRSNHALPFVLLTLCGGAWAGVGLQDCLLPAALVYTLFFTLLIHNDYYDRSEDKLAGRIDPTSADDVQWSLFLFLQGVLLAMTRGYLVLSLLLLLGLLAGYLYHHPSTRLKARFCLSYKVEGVWALVAFLAGCFGLPEQARDVSLGVPALLAFGGGTLVSIPKDWKDIASDRASRIPTYYVVGTRAGADERTVHKRVVAAVSLGLLLPPVALYAWRGPGGWLLALALVALAPAIVLLRSADRRAAVEHAMWAFSLYLTILYVALR